MTSVNSNRNNQTPERETRSQKAKNIASEIVKWIAQNVEIESFSFDIGTSGSRFTYRKPKARPNVIYVQNVNEYRRPTKARSKRPTKAISTSTRSAKGKTA